MLTPLPRTRGAALASEVEVVREPGTHSKRKQNQGDGKHVTQWKTLLLIFGVVLYSTNSIMFVWAKGESTHFHFILSSVVFMSEVARVLFCCGLVVCSGAWRHLSTSDFFNKTILNYSFPAIAYAINDQIAFTCLEEMDSATFQTLSSLKIIFTALSCRVFLKHNISEKQWLGLFSLFVSLSESDTDFFPLSLPAESRLLFVFTLEGVLFLSPTDESFFYLSPASKGE